MKSLSLFIMLTVCVSITSAQSPKSCCVGGSATEEFAMLVNDPKFVNSHLAPIPFPYQAAAGSWITFKTPDGGEGRAFEVKASKPTDNVILLFHEWWGLNEYIQKEAENWQKELGNVNVLALDLYDKKVATTQEDAAKAMGELKESRAKAIVEGALKHVGSKARIGTIGWCMGGGWSLQASLLAEKQAVACVMYYGMPEKDTVRLKSLASPVLFIFASEDQWINESVVDEFRKTMKIANKSLDVRTYKADHAFANPSNPQFDKEATADAHKNAAEFFKRNLLK